MGNNSTEATVRRDLQLEDADGIDCLPNATIFEQLTLMDMVKNLDRAGKFLMYPRFVQVFLDNQLEGMINHNKIYIAPSHTKKVFVNMKRQGKDFSSRVTPLFSTMMVQAQQEQGGVDEDVYKERDDSLERATTTATGLDTKQDKCGGPRCQNTMGDTIAQTSLQLKELMEFCTKLQQRVLDLENTKTTQAQEITSMKKRVKKLERKKTSITHGIKRLYKVGLSARIDSSDDEASLGYQEDASKQGRKIHDIDADEDITLENVHDADMFGVYDLDGDEVFVETEEPVVNAATTTSTIPVSAAKDLSDVDMPLAQALAELKSTKTKAVTTAAIITTTVVTRPKAKGLVIQEQEQASTPITSLKDKGKGIMFEEPLKMKKKDQVLFDEQDAIRLQAQFDEDERIAREKEEANAALIAQWNDIQDKVETDYELAQRLQAEEQEALTIKEKSKLFQQLLEKRRKHFAAKRPKERRNRQPTKAQQRSIMCVYLKSMAGWKPKDLNTKIGGSSKKQKVDDDKETEELKQCMEIISDDGDDVTIEATPLSTKSPTIILKNFDREDLEVLWTIVKARFKKTELMNYMDIFLHLNLKTMFEHHLEDNVWKNQQGLVNVLNWKLYDSCGVHCVTMQNIL
ncbi:hypothetical protein Tco_0838571 [Tanacetum coccineum]|uniref:Uncharacterized protein n=1 Tax=Tanacetum coccineum TaxID=301880 RepID=A0ABQ5ASP7_9ASTR